jgi:CRP/FNR family transcriptional regulator, cyclic AMP receptor protein
MATYQPPADVRAAVIDLLGGGVCAALPADTVAALVENGRVRPFPAGQTMYAEADSAGLAMVLDGLVRVYMHAGDGRQVTVRYARAGGLLGVPSLVAGPAPVFVQGLVAGAVFVFDAARAARLARTDARLAWALAEESAHRLYDVLEELAGNTFASVRQRVVRHLLDLAAANAPAGGPLTARVNQQDLANSTGSVREVVGRVLAELRAERLVRTSPGRVEILDPVRLSRQLWSRQRDESHSA